MPGPTPPGPRHHMPPASGGARDTHAPGADPFAFLSKVDPHRLSAELAREGARTAAIVLSRIDRTQAAKAIADIPVEMRQPIAAAMKQAKNIPAEALAAVANSLRDRLYHRSAPPPPAPGMVQYGGAHVAAGILRFCPPEVRQNLKAADPQLFASLRQLMYTFDDFLRTPDRSLQIIFAEVEVRTIAMAMRVAMPELRGRIHANLSARRAQLLEDEEERLDKVRMRDIEEARTNIVDHALALQSAGKIILDPAEETA